MASYSSVSRLLAGSACWHNPDMMSVEYPTFYSTLYLLNQAITVIVATRAQMAFMYLFFLLKKQNKQVVVLCIFPDCLIETSHDLQIIF